MVTFSSSSGVQYRLGTTTVDSIMLFAENHFFHITFISLFDFRKNQRLKVAIQYWVVADVEATSLQVS